jgi:hypothetical protein
MWVCYGGLAQVERYTFMPIKNVEDYIFRLDDYRGKEVLFTKEKWEKKRFRHPELNKSAFLKCLLRTIADPDEVWEDYEDRENKRCYYKKYSSVSYAKIVVSIASNPCVVITAYEISGIKETNYFGLRRVR